MYVITTKLNMDYVFNAEICIMYDLQIQVHECYGKKYLFRMLCRNIYQKG